MPSLVIRCDTKEKEFLILIQQYENDCRTAVEYIILIDNAHQQLLIN